MRYLTFVLDVKYSSFTRFAKNFRNWKLVNSVLLTDKVVRRRPSGHSSFFCATRVTIFFVVNALYMIIGKVLD